MESSKGSRRLSAIRRGLRCWATHGEGVGSFSRCRERLWKTSSQWELKMVGAVASWGSSQSSGTGIVLRRHRESSEKCGEGVERFAMERSRPEQPSKDSGAQPSRAESSRVGEPAVVELKVKEATATVGSD